MKKPYEHFKTATYIYAYDLENADLNELRENLISFCDRIHIDKVYIENHRGKTDIPVEDLIQLKKMCEELGLETAGGITLTQHINKIRKPSIYDTFCYTDPTHRKEALRIAGELAQVFDEIILDDFFFTACRCEMCIDAKGTQTWKEYRLSLMEEFSKELVREVKTVNPTCKFVIKFPNWYESYSECGYYPEKQKDLFDGVYTGTETRTPDSAQHLQRYESYSIMRYMENIAPGKNGGGWIDLFGSLDCTHNLLEQMEATLLGGAKELMFWNFGMYRVFQDLPVLADFLYKTDRCLAPLGKPVGLSVWEPFNADAEEQIYNYLGMCGMPLEPTPYIDESAPVVLCTAATAEDPSSVEKLKTYVRNGGNAVVTLGYYRAMYDKGIRDFSSVTLTNRHVFGKDYRIQNANYFDDEHYAEGDKPILYEIINYKTNATNCNIAVMGDECNFPVMTEDNYGKGRFFILNVPENFADLYKLPAEVIRNINKHLSMGMPVYIGAEPCAGLFAFDNNKYLLRSYHTEKAIKIQVVVRGECQGIRTLVPGTGYDAEYAADLVPGTEYTDKKPLPLPSCMADATTVIEEPAEYAIEMELQPGDRIIFECI